MESCRKTWRQSNRRAETVVALDPTAELPSVWAAHVGSPGEPQPGTLPSAAQTPWRGAAGVALGAANTPHAPVPGPPLAVSPHVTGCLHVHLTPPASGGLPLSLLTGSGEVSAPGQGAWLPWQLPGQGWGQGLDNTDQKGRKGGVPGGKLWWEGASRPAGHRPGRRGRAPHPFPSDVSWGRRCLEPQNAGGAFCWRHNLEFAAPHSSLRLSSSITPAVLGFLSKQRAAVRFCPCWVFQGIPTKVVIQMW